MSQGTIEHRITEPAAAWDTAPMWETALVCEHGRWALRHAPGLDAEARTLEILLTVVKCECACFLPLRVLVARLQGRQAAIAISLPYAEDQVAHE